MDTGSETGNTSKSVIGVLIPVYNEFRYLPSVLEEIKQLQDRRQDVLFKIAIVDDGSTRSMPAIIRNSPEIHLLKHEENRGKGAALRTGFEYFLNHTHAVGVLTMDADLQHPPASIPLFLNAFHQKKGALIIGRRTRDISKMPFHRIVSNTLTSLILSFLVGQYIPDSQCGFRFYSRSVLASILVKEHGFHFESEILLRSGWRKFSFAFVPVPTIYNEAHSSIRNVSDTFKFIAVVCSTLLDRVKGYV